MTYDNAGVNQSLGDQASRILYEAAQKTWHMRSGLLGEVIVPVDDFSGLRVIDVSALPQGVVMNMGFDGVGTKIEIAERVHNHRTIAFDLIAMVCDDAVIRGGEPVLVGSILDVNRLKASGDAEIGLVNQLAEGYVRAALEANVAIINGEVAELGNRVSGYGEFSYNWGAAVLWFAHRDRLITGRSVSVGDTIVAFEETGVRSNGLSLLRTVFDSAYGNDWHQAAASGHPLGELALTPSRIYTPAVVRIVGGVYSEQQAPIHGAAHITGGGIPGKLGRILKVSGFGARLNDLFDTPWLMKHAQEVGKVDDQTAYSTWNMGQGMLLITPEPDTVQAIAQHFDITSKVVGHVIQEPVIEIHSKGHFASGVLQYPLK